jgi:hypothetical protein
MALTQDQWYEKLKGFVPAWWFTQAKYAPAVFQGIAAMFAALQVDADDQFAATFLEQSGAPVLDVMGSERSVTRLTSETNASYAARIQRITSHTDLPAIKAAIDALLVNGTCTIAESPLDNPYIHRNAYCGRDNYLTEMRQNFFWILLPSQTQVHTPYDFCARSVYAARGNYVGTQGTTSPVYDSIIALVNRMKAFGVMYGIVETT